MHDMLQPHGVEPTEPMLGRLAAALIQGHDQHTVLIGDTPKDVEAALTAGLRVIAVASGKSDESELMEAGAPVAVPDLTHTATVVQLVINGLSNTQSTGTDAVIWE